MDLFTELSLIIVVTTVVTGVIKLFKQPLVIGYILTGLLLSPFLSHTLGSQETLKIFSEMGIAILLFIVGLHLSPKEVTSVGRASFLVGFFQVLLTSLSGYALARILGFSNTESLYAGFALSLSSTIIVLKLLSDKKDLEKLYSRVAIGILLLQDVVACIALIFVSTLDTGNSGISPFIFLALKGVLLLAAVYLTSNFILPKLGKFLARSQEYLALFSLAWGFGLASLFSYFGFSLEIGALIAGVGLSISPYSAEISAKLKPLRDFFIVMFFVVLGSQVKFDVIPTLWAPILVFTLFIIFLKPLLVIILMGMAGYNRKTAFFEGICLAQVSEFSLILGLLGVSQGAISEQLFSIFIVSAVASITLSSYLMMFIEKIYPHFASDLRFFERAKPREEKSIVTSYDVILFGANRLGYDFIRAFHDLGSGFLCVDFDPDVIKILEKERINCIYGDVEDADFLDDINVEKSNVIISTIPDFEANIFLVKTVRSLNKSSTLILLAYNLEDALKLYEEGASYVILPHFISGEYAASLAAKANVKGNLPVKTTKEHIEYLTERKTLGHSHPTWLRKN